MLEPGRVAQPAARLYYPAWQQLRTNKVVVLKVAPHNVARVRKAVRKEKDMDLGFKLECQEVSNCLQVESKYDSTSWQLKITLVPQRKYSVENL